MLLHGRGSGPSQFLSDQLFAALDRPNAPIVVLPNGGDHSYWHDRRDGQWGSLVLDHVIPDAQHLFHTKGKVAIGGISMGGYGALLAAETEPKHFAAVVAVSLAVWTSYEAMMLGPRDAFDSASDFAKYDVIGHADRLAGVNLRIDCGLSDPFYGYVTHLEAALPEPPGGGYSEGGHDNDYWQRVAPAEAEFIGRAFG